MGSGNKKDEGNHYSLIPAPVVVGFGVGASLSPLYLPREKDQPEFWMLFSGGSDGKECACRAGDLGSIPGLGKSPGEGNGNALQYSCLENPVDRGAWLVTVHGFAESDTPEGLTS